MSEKKSDSDWKTRAKAEKEQLQQDVEEKRDKGMPDQFPEPSFTFILTSYVTQAYISLGEMENPTTGKKEVDLAAAKFFIDLMDILKEKTKGNLGDDEAKALDAVLAELRLRFVQASAK
jgi:hypothetical protein